MIIAARHYSKKLIEYLLEKGASINEISGSQTCLDIIDDQHTNFTQRVNNMKNSERVYRIFNQMKEHKEDSLEWFCLNEYKEQHLQGKTLEEWEETRKKSLVDLRSSLKYLKSIKDFIFKKGAKRS